MMLCGQACHSGWKGNQFSFSGTPWDDTATPTVFHANSKGDDNNTDNQCIFEEVGVWRESITPARRLKLAAVKGNHLIMLWYWKNYRKLKNSRVPRWMYPAKRSSAKEPSWTKVG